VIIFRNKLNQFVFVMEAQVVRCVTRLAVRHTKYYLGDHLKNN